MKRILVLLALSITAALGVVPAAGAAPAAKPSEAQIVGVVRAGEGSTATVRVRYTCADGIHLWVAAKQTAARDRDPILEQEGSSRHAAAYLQSHPGPDAFTCDGKTRVDTFTIDTLEWGKGELRRGEAWVQFCMYGQTTAITEGRWVPVR